MILLVLLPLVAVAILSALSCEPALERWHRMRVQLARGVRYRVKQARLPDDWWEQFERDLSAYLDPLAVRARDEERLG